MRLIKLASYAIAGYFPGGRYRCVLCGHCIWRFMPYMGGSIKTSKLMREMNMVGSNLDQFECPRCGAHDRERHLLLYLEKKGLLLSMRNKCVLHFAPERRLAQHIADNSPARYIRCDLYPSTPDLQRVDILEMKFENESFDFIIANHVLEHVNDDLKALGEIQRVLKPGGYAILQTPYSKKLHHTWEDAGIDSDAARLQAYGQKDHVRLFGRDIFSRFLSTGLLSLVQQHNELLSDINSNELGINPNEPFFLFQRRS